MGKNSRNRNSNRDMVGRHGWQSGGLTLGGAAVVLTSTFRSFTAFHRQPERPALSARRVRNQQLYGGYGIGVGMGCIMDGGPPLDRTVEVCRNWNNRGGRPELGTPAAGARHWRGRPCTRPQERGTEDRERLAKLGQVVQRMAVRQRKHLPASKRLAEHIVPATALSPPGGPLLPEGWAVQYGGPSLHQKQQVPARRRGPSGDDWHTETTGRVAQSCPALTASECVTAMEARVSRHSGHCNRCGGLHRACLKAGQH